MYSEKTETTAEYCGTLNESVQAIGTTDAFKVNAIGILIQKLSAEPSEIIAITSNNSQSVFWGRMGIACVQDLKEVGRVLGELVTEMHDRQKLSNCYGKVKHRIVVVVEIDSLHSALMQRAIELNHQYSERELDGAVSMLREHGTKVEMFVVESVSKPKVEIGCRMYSGLEAIKYILDETTNVSKAVYQRVTQRIEGQTHPCCLVVGEAELVYPIEGVTDKPVPLKIQFVSEDERAIDL